MGNPIVRVASDWRSLSRFLFDLLALLVSWPATIWVRVFLNEHFSKQFTAEALGAIVPRMDYVLVMWVVLSLWFDLYGQATPARWIDAVGRSTRSLVLANLITIFVTFYSRNAGQDLSRSYAMLFIPVSALVVLATTTLWFLLTHRMRHHLAGRTRIALIGGGDGAAQVIRAIRAGRPRGVELAGVIRYNGQEMGQLPADVPLLGSTDELAELINREAIRHLIVAGRDISQAVVEECGTISTRMGVTMTRPLAGNGSAHMRLTETFGLPTLDMVPVSFTRGQEVVKRLVDVVGALAALVAALPLMAALVVLIRWTSPGPAFYRSKRVGKGGRHFRLYKFRSMYIDQDRRLLVKLNEQAGHLFKLKDDPRVTPVGKFIRRYSLDELPQLFNVLLGDMSLVGPRPLPAEDLGPDGMSKEFQFWAEQRARVVPGLTGLWQISGRSDAGFDRMIELDVEYIRNWSLGLDLRILLQTPWVVLTAKGAY